MKRDLHPTNKCFDDSMDLMVDMMRSNPREEWSKIRLVHALVDVGDGPFSHAWCESDEEVFSVMLLDGERVAVRFTFEEYAEHFPVVDVTKYTVDEAFEQNRKHVNYGPWERRYLEGCRNFSPELLLRHSHNP